MIRELISGCHSKAIRFPIRTDEITGGDFRLFAAVFGIRGNNKCFAMSTDDRTITLVKPLGSHSDDAGSRLSRRNPPLKNAHAVSKFVFFEIVHSIAVASAA